MDTNFSHLSPSSVSSEMLQSSYTDLQQLDRIRQLGRDDQQQALKELSKQFESIFVHMMLKSMRDANAAFEEGSMFQSNEMDFYRDMMDQNLSLHLSQGQGLGLADSFYQQMVRQFEVDEHQQALADINVKPLDMSIRNTDRPYQYVDKANASSSPVSFAGQQDFVQTLLPHAQTAAQQLGVDPKILIAQSALETGWGQYVISDKSGSSSYNLFNIKADSRWSGGKVSMPTLEYTDGVMKPEIAAFRRYQNFEESMQDYVNFIRNESRYQNALQSSEDSTAYIKALHQAGYATDPNYSEKVIRLLNSESLKEISSHQPAVATAPRIFLETSD